MKEERFHTYFDTLRTVLENEYSEVDWEYPLYNEVRQKETEDADQEHEEMAWEECAQEDHAAAALTLSYELAQSFTPSSLSDTTVRAWYTEKKRREYWQDVGERYETASGASLLTTDDMRNMHLFTFHIANTVEEQTVDDELVLDRYNDAGFSPLNHRLDKHGHEEAIHFLIEDIVNVLSPGEDGVELPQRDNDTSVLDV